MKQKKKKQLKNKKEICENIEILSSQKFYRLVLRLKNTKTKQKPKNKKSNFIFHKKKRA